MFRGLKNPTPRICKLCPNEFTPNSHNQLYCEVCVPDWRVSGWVSRFGLSKPMYDAIVARQGGGCGICGRLLSELPINKTAIDHDHKTNQVRGVLCMRCNTWLAALEEPDWFERAKRYLNIIS